MSQITLLENLTFILENLKRSESLYELNDKLSKMEYTPITPTAGTVYDRVFWVSPFCHLSIIVTRDTKMYLRVGHGPGFEDYYEIITESSITPKEVIEVLDYINR